MKLTIFTALPLTQIYGTERVFLITCNLLKENGHFPRIVSLTPEDVSLPVAPALSYIAINRYPIKLHRLSLIWVLLCTIFKFKNGIWLKAIKKDLQANGIPDITLVTDPKFIPDLIKALTDTSSNTKVFYWDHLLINFHQFLKRHDGKNIKGLEKRLYLWVYSRIFKGVLKMVDGALAISSGTKRALSFFIPENKIPLVFNPIEMNSSKLISRSAFPTFIYIGRLEDVQKNLSFMLKGLAKQKEENWKLKILGTGPDETTLRKLSEDLGISERI
uniref:Glycosyl transferase family 1 domain-containing protein n=1 Tax=candidate division CPR3 bacterium TaxID=2268181 RepID=A0A7V3J910_UNCC3